MNQNNKNFPANAGASHRNKAPLRIALLGFGVVGSSVAELVARQSLQSVEVTHVFNRNWSRRKVSDRARFVPDTAVWTDDIEVVLEADDVDVVLELMGG